MLISSDAANAKAWVKVAIPSTNQNGRPHNNSHSKRDFRGEGFADRTKYRATITPQDIGRAHGGDINKVTMRSKVEKVNPGELQSAVTSMGKFTTIEFTALP